MIAYLIGLSSPTRINSTPPRQEKEVEAIKTRAKVLKQVIDQHLSVRKTRELVTQVLDRHNSQIIQKQQKTVSKYISYIKDMEVSKLSQEDKAALIEVLEAKLIKLRSKQPLLS